MAAAEPKKRLFGVRIYPESGPHAIVALLASSASEAETMARGKAGASAAAAPVSVFECADDETVFVTFRSNSTSTATP